MALSKFEKDMAVIQKLDDEPNDVGGLTAAELKAKFDEGGEAVKKYLNDTLTPELEHGFSEKVPSSTTINGHPLTGDVTITKSDVELGNVDNTSDLDKPVSTAQQAALDALDNKKANAADVLTKDNHTPYTPTEPDHPATKGYVDETTAGVVMGQLPDSGVTTAKLAEKSVTTEKLADGAVTPDKLDRAYLPLSGGTVTGPITLPGDPTQPLQAAPKQYVDTVGTNAAALIRSYPIASGQTVTAGQVVDVTSNVPPTVGQYVPGSIQVQNVPVGSFITRTENGVPQYYLVVHQGLPSEMYDASCNGTWVLRLNIYENAAWDAGNSNVLPGADIFTTMAGMLSLFDAETQAAIKTVKIPYCVGGGQSTVQSGANGLQCQIFPLGGYEYGITTAQQSALPVDGATLAYFSDYTSNPRRILAILNGVLSNHWTRSQNTASSQYSWYIANSATLGNTNASDTNRGIRPAFILDPTLEVDGYYESVSEAITTYGTPSQAIALQDGNAGDLIDIIYSGTAELPGTAQGTKIESPGVQGYAPMEGLLEVFPWYLLDVKIATGSYVGTGTYGSDSPVTIKTPFKPKFVVIQSESNISSYRGYVGVAAYGAGWIKISGSYNSTGYNPASLTWMDNGISFYSLYSDHDQFNFRAEYVYTIFG